MLRENINKLLAENYKLSQELEDIYKKRDNLMNIATNKINEIEIQANSKQAYCQEERQDLLKKLISKRDELDEIQNFIKEFNNDLIYIKHRQNKAKFDK